MPPTKNPTKHNDTPNTPDVNESEVARMKADDLRGQLKKRGVKGTAELKKPELVQKMIKALLAESRSGAKKRASTRTSVAAASTKSAAKSSAKSAAKSSATSSGKASDKSSAKSSGKGASKNPTSHNDTPNTPDVNESEVARMKVAQLRRRLADRGVKGTDELKKPELVKKVIKALLADAKGSSAKKGGAVKGGAVKGGAVKSGTGKSGTTVGAKVGSAKKSGGSRSTLRTGKNTSSSLKYSQEITSTEDRPERAGRSLVTTDHEVIRQWAKARKAVPATVEGTEHGDHLGVLRFDFPGYTGDRLSEVSWEDWLATFDKRRLNFIYQEKLSSGKRSNFFQLQSADGADD